MCGRTSLFVPPSVVEERFDAEFRTEYVPRYNVAPRQDLYAVGNDDPDAIDAFEWGLLPGFVDDPEDSPRPINARAETVHEKPYFREAYGKRRCLVLADGFYEWAGQRGSKEPYRIQRTDDQPFAFAGLWETWTPGGDARGGEGDARGGEGDARGGEGDAGGGEGDAGDESDAGDEGDAAGGESADEEALHTCTIVTTDANDVVAPIHDRMPVILAEDEEAAWLHEADQTVLDPFENEPLEAYPVSKAVNNPQNDSPAVVEPLDTEQSGFDAFTD